MVGIGELYKKYLVTRTFIRTAQNEFVAKGFVDVFLLVQNMIMQCDLMDPMVQIQRKCFYK